VFTKYDRDKDGHIDKNELHAVFTSELNLEKTLDDVEKLMAKETGMNGVKHFLQQKSEYTIFLQSLPADLRGRIEDFDTNKDGELSAEEMTGILNAFYVAERERDHANQLARNWKMVSLAAFVAFISMCVAVFFASALATEWRKEMSVDSDGTIVSRDGAVLQTATKTTTRALTSRIPNKNLAQLSTFSYIDPTSGTTMSVHVNSFVRVPDQMAHCGSVVVLQTSLGTWAHSCYVRVSCHLSILQPHVWHVCSPMDRKFHT
jgi:Ca2+-binding EF-hand superfamily protein